MLNVGLKANTGIWVFSMRGNMQKKGKKESRNT